MVKWRKRPQSDELGERDTELREEEGDGILGKWGSWGNKSWDIIT